MKRVIAVLGWAFAFWFAPAMTAALILGPLGGAMTPGKVHHVCGSQVLLHIMLPMGCGVPGMGLGLLGLLPGTGPEDAGKSED